MNRPRSPKPMKTTATTLAVAILALVGFVATSARGSEPIDPEHLQFFETHVRPLLAESCYQCHGSERQRGGLRLDSLAAILQGGHSGPAIEPGSPVESLIVEVINYESYEMPPDGQLSDEQIAVLTRWVELGAPWPEADRDAPSPVSPIAKITDEDRAFWSFQPPQDPEVPEVAGSRHPIDRFIRARLAEDGLEPAPEADRRTLIRRLSFDLHGLPPSAEEVEAFVHDPDPNAYENLVDRLLDSPRYGERWARHWLDLVRYAESDGHRQDAYRPNAWRYRDYVVQAFNDDMPYDRFLTEQLAGDELEPDNPDVVVATGFLRLGMYEFNQRDVRGQWDDILNDLTDVTADVFLGLGMACARCHDHKFDPILQKDYYRLQAFFAPLLLRDERLLASPEEAATYALEMAAWELMTAEIREAIAEIERPYREKGAQEAIDKFQEEYQEILAKPWSERTPLERQLGELAYRQVEEEYFANVSGRLNEEEKARWEDLQEQLAAFDRYKPTSPPKGRFVTNVGPVAPETRIPGARQSEPIAPGFLTVLDEGPTPLDSLDSPHGRRLVLARWLASPDHPMTARVMVNRIWQYHFGRGLVATASDYGRLGEPPTHPELLDWLTTRFVAGGWRLKPIHRLIATSATYRQASRSPISEAARSLDEENRLLWRGAIRRLDAEEIRDAILAVSGELDLRTAGPGVEPSQPRRSIYTKVIRNTRDDLMDAFDAPDGIISTPKRNVTTTPTQALLLLNSPWTLDRARALAHRLVREAGDDPVAQIDLAFRVAFARSPDESERAEALAFLEQQREVVGEPSEALADLCHALINSSEFLYIE